MDTFYLNHFYEGTFVATRFVALAFSLFNSEVYRFNGVVYFRSAFWLFFISSLPLLLNIHSEWFVIYEFLFLLGAHPSKKLPGSIGLLAKR